MTPTPKVPDSLPEDHNSYMHEFTEELREQENEIIEKTKKSFHIFTKWEKAAKIEEKNGDFLNAAFLYKKLKNDEKLILCLEKAAKVFERKGQLTKASYLYIKIDKLEKAAQLLEKWCRYNKESSYYSKKGENLEIFEAKTIELYVKLNNIKKVYRLLISGKQYEKAANLLTKNGQLEKAAILLEKTQHPLKAADLYEKIGQVKKANLLRAEEAYKKNNDKTAAELFKKAGDFVMAAEQYQSAKQWVKAAECFALNSNYINAAECYLINSNFKEAIEMYEFAGEWKKAADNLMKIKEFQKAGEYYAKCGKLFKAGNSFLKNKDTELAVKNFQKVTQDSKDYFKSNIEVAKIFLETGQAELVISKLEKLINKDTSNELNKELRYYLARSYENRIMLKKAKDMYKQILNDDYLYKDVQKRVIEVENEKQKYDLQEARRNDAVKRYKILSKLGEGGMGVVYKTLDLHLNRTVAIKKLLENYAKDDLTFKMFQKEARAIAALSHPNIVKIFDFGQMYEDSFISMEYLKGKDLHSTIEKEGKYAYSIKEIITFIEDISSALYYAHEKGIIHQDIKPHNIILTEDQGLKIMDFGIASIVGQQNLLSEDTIIGTPSYMAPEQITRKNVSHKVDIYSAGITLFYILAGEVPFKGDNILSKQLHQAPPSILKFRPETPAALVQILEKCLQKDPSDRFNNGKEIIEQIKKIDLESIKEMDRRKASQKKIKKSHAKTIIIPKKHSEADVIQEANKTLNHKKTEDDNDQTSKSIDLNKTTLKKSTFREKTAKISYTDSGKTIIKK